MKYLKMDFELSDKEKEIKFIFLRHQDLRGDTKVYHTSYSLVGLLFHNVSIDGGLTRLLTYIAQ